MLKLYKKLKHIKYRLKEWKKDTYGNIDQEKNNIEEKIKNLQETCILEGYNEEWKKEEIQMTREWEARCQKEETLWWKNTWIKWLK